MSVHDDLAYVATKRSYLGLNEQHVEYVTRIHVQCQYCMNYNKPSSTVVLLALGQDVVLYQIIKD